MFTLQTTVWKCCPMMHSFMLTRYSQHPTKQCLGKPWLLVVLASRKIMFFLRNNRLFVTLWQILTWSSILAKPMLHTHLQTGSTEALYNHHRFQDDHKMLTHHDVTHWFVDEASCLALWTHLGFFGARSDHLRWEGGTEEDTNWKCYECINVVTVVLAKWKS